MVRQWPTTSSTVPSTRCRITAQRSTWPRKRWPSPALLAGPAGIGAAGRAVGRALVMRVAEAAIAAAQQHMARVGRDEVEQHLVVLLVEDLRADGNAQHHRRSARAAAVGAHAVMALLGAEMLLVAVVDEGVEIGHRLDDDVAAAAAVAAIGAAELDEFLAPEAARAGTAVAALHEDLGLVEEFHGLSRGANDKGGMRPFPLRAFAVARLAPGGTAYSAASGGNGAIETKVRPLVVV